MEKKVFSPTPKQKEAAKIAAAKTITLYGGAIRGGKSWWMCLLLITYCFKYPKSRWLLIRKDLPTFKRTTLSTLKVLLDEGFGQYVSSFDQQGMTITFTNGSQLMMMMENFAEDKELNRFKGLEINGAGCDECNELQEKTFEKIIERSGSWQGSPGCPIKILMTCNPSQGWVKKRFYLPALKGTLPESYAYIPAKITDNPHISQEYLISLKENMSALQYEQFVEGNWDIVDIDKPFMYNFEFHKHTENFTDQPDRKLPLILSFDFNIDPITCIVVQHSPKMDKIRVFREFRLRNSDINELCRAIKNAYPHYYYIVTGDASGMNGTALEKGINFYVRIQKMLQILGTQIRVPSKNPPIKGNRVLCNTILEKHPDLLIHRDNCPYLVEDCQYVEVTELGEINKKQDARRTHLLDTLRYYFNTFHFRYLNK